MNELLKPFLRKFVAIFFDDLLDYSPSWTTHFHHLEVVFFILSQGSFHLCESKCVFSKTKLQYLGHIVSTKGVAPDPSQISVMVDWPNPTNTSDLWGFLGLTRFYRCFIRGYAIMATPLTTLLCKDHFTLSDDAQRTLDKLKQAMTSTLMLTPLTSPFLFSRKQTLLASW